MEISKIELRPSGEQYKLYYDGIYLSRQSIISLCKLLVDEGYKRKIYDHVHNRCEPDYMVLNYLGCVQLIRTILKDYRNAHL